MSLKRIVINAGKVLPYAAVHNYGLRVRVV